LRAGKAGSGRNSPQSTKPLPRLTIFLDYFANPLPSRTYRFYCESETGMGNPGTARNHGPAIARIKHEAHGNASRE
jgi:hypothetical protein